jgi:hypothetical protein
MTARSIGRNVIGAIVTTRVGAAPQVPLAKAREFHYALTHPAADDGRFWVQLRGRELRQWSRRPTFQSTLIAGAVAVRYTPLCPLFKSAQDASALCAIEIKVLRARVPGWELGLAIKESGGNVTCLTVFRKN